VKFRIEFADGSVLITTQFYRRMPDGFLRPISISEVRIDRRYFAARGSEYVCLSNATAIYSKS
jgi:hypothetical protein